MATFQDDMQSHATSEVANNSATTGITGWTWKSNGSSAYQNGTIVDIGGGVKVLRIEDTGWGVGIFMYPTAIGSLGAGVAAEVLVKWRVHDITADSPTVFGHVNIPAIRANIAATSSPGFNRTAVGFRSKTTGGAAVQQQVWYFQAADNWGSIGSVKTLSGYVAGDWWWTRLTVTAGGLWTASSWKDGTSESAGDIVSATSDTELTSGYLGLAAYDLTYDPIDIGYFSAGTAGASAPSPGGDTTAPTYGSNPAVSAGPSSTAVTISATASDETDTAVDHYVGIYASGNTPTAAQIKAGSGTGLVAGTNKTGANVANGVATTYGGSITGLTASTAYDAWATVEEHGSTKNLHTPFQVAFTTLAALTSPLGVMDTTTGPTGNTASGGITVTGSAGTAYWYLSNSATPPSVANLKSGSGSLAFGNVAISGPGAIAFNNKGSLAEKTNYYFHYVVNQNSQDSAISSSAAFQATDSPTLSSATGTATAGTTADLSVATNRAAVGSIYVVVTTSATKPTSTQIKAGQNHLGAAAAYANTDASVTNPNLWSATGLVASTGYFAHFYQEDAGGDGSNIITSNAFTTLGVGTYNVDSFSAGIRPGGTVTVTISGAWAASGKTATINGHPVTLATQSAIQCTFVAPSLHTDPTYVDTKYNVPVQFVLTDGAFQGSKNLTELPPSGYDFVEVTGVSGIWADDTGVAVGDDHLGHWTTGTADPISSTGVLSNITGYPATYVYWRFDESEGVWTASASEVFYEIVAFDGPDYTDKTYYTGGAITAFNGAAGFNAATANISAYASTGAAVPGLSLNTSTASLTGTPTTPGVYQFTIKATDSDSNVAFCNTFNITVYGAPTWSASPGNQTWMDGDVIALPLSSFVNADGLHPASSYSKLAGTYPSGITLDGPTGLLSGTVASDASQSSPYNGHQYRATNTAGNGDSAVFNITVLPLAPTFVGPNIANIGSLAGGAPMTPVDVSAKFAVYITSYALIGSVPAGISINSSGVISGTPTTFGTFSGVVVRATNVSGTVDSNAFTITASAQAPTFTGSIADIGPLARLVVMTPVDVTAQFAGGPATSYAFVGTPPPGITISLVGVISGQPTVSGTTSGLKVRKSNPGGSADSNAFSITVLGVAPTVTSPPLPDRSGFVGQVISIDFKALFSNEDTVALTNLPSGLTDTAGVVSGTLTTVQSKVVTATATNVFGSLIVTFTWAVAAAAPVFATKENMVRSAGKAISVDFKDFLTQGQAPYTFTSTGSALPPGLTLDGATGVVSGLVDPGDIGVYTGIVIRAANAAGNNSTNAFTWTIQLATSGGGGGRMGISI